MQITPPSAAPTWVDPMMRVGYTARGSVYVLLGVLALLAAWTGDRTPDSKGALRSLLDEPLGEVMLSAIAAGLAAYAVWSCINAWLDLDDVGSGLKGWVARGAQVISGGMHLLLGITAAMLAARAEASGDHTRSWTAQLMGEPFGRWAVAAIGGIVIAFGVQFFVAVYQQSYKQSLRYTATTARLDPL
jgi:hypothetical protein